MVETALKINPPLCVSSPPAWAQPFTVRGKAFIRPGHISLFLYNQINLKCLQPDLWNARSSWRISEQHTSIFGSNATLYILIFLRFLAVMKKILRCNRGHHKPKDREKKSGGGFRTVHYSSRDLAVALQQRAQVGPACCKKTTHTDSFFQLHQAKN